MPASKTKALPAPSPRRTSRPAGQRPGEVRQERDGGLRPRDSLLDIHEHADRILAAVRTDGVLDSKAAKAHLKTTKATASVQHLFGTSRDLQKVGISPQEAAVQRVVHSALAFAKAEMREHNGDNITPATVWWKSVFGWGLGSAWCAMFACMVGDEAGVLTRKDYSAGAWALLDHLRSLGLALSGPQPGCLIGYNWGSGHIEVVVALDKNPNYVYTVGGNTGNGNPQEGDGCYLVRRYLPGQLYSRTPFAMYPGVKSGATVAAPPSWFGRITYYRRYGGQFGTGADIQTLQKAVGLKGAQVTGVWNQQTSDAYQRWCASQKIDWDGMLRRWSAVKMQHFLSGK